MAERRDGDKERGRKGGLEKWTGRQRVKGRKRGMGRKGRIKGEGRRGRQARREGRRNYNCRSMLGRRLGKEGRGVNG